jgi:ubiquinone/menaquinone biosynthesis C-methylase UbiE
MTMTAQGFYGRTYGGNATENYERFFVPMIGKPLADDLISAARLGPGERVLDVACGTGIVARLAADRVGPSGVVAGVDVNAGMLAVARAASSGQTLIHWYETAAEAMPLPDASFDVVFSQLALQFFADRSAALNEMRRVLAAGGRLFVSVPAPTEFFDVLEGAIARHVGAAAGAFVHQVFSLNQPGELERLLRDAGFDDVNVRLDPKALHLPPAAEFLWQYVHSTPLAAATGELDAAHRSALEHDVATGWQRWADDRGLSYVQPILIAAARK